MKLRDFMDLKVIQNIQDSFSDSTGLAAIAVDDEGNYITKGSNFTDFCMKYTRGSEEGLRRCVKCDNECTGTYFCHAGLMDFASDITIEGKRVGAIIGGQVLPHKPDENQFREIARELNIDEKQYIEALSKVPIRSESMIRASAKMLENVVNQLVNLEYFKYVNQKRINVISQETASMLSEVERIVSKTKDLRSIATMENMLSLNASIEAARAGQAGVGFAVVAREMGDLSKKSSHIYNEINDSAVMIEKSVSNITRRDL